MAAIVELQLQTALGENEGMLGIEAKRLLSFRGRARRSTTWAIVFAGGGVPFLFIAGLSYLPDPYNALLFLACMGLWLWVMSAALVRRCHDRGRSGWIILLFALPLTWFWLLPELGFARGEGTANSYGPSPKPLPKRRLPASLYDGLQVGAEW